MQKRIFQDNSGNCWFLPCIIFIYVPHLIFCIFSFIFQKQLLKLHGMSSTIWFRRTRLADRAKFIKEMDRAIERENGPQNLSLEHLRFACYVRGLNPVTMRNEDMIQWLSEWLKVSKHIDYESASLLLHCPILLAYNLPTNWKLIYN